MKIQEMSELPQFQVSQLAKPCECVDMDLSKIVTREVKVGELLGSGSFCSVYSVNVSLSQVSECQEEVDHSENESTSCIASVSEMKDCIVAKMLHNGALSRSMKEVESTVSDFVLEAKILSQLPQHPNIIKFYGVSQYFWDKPATGYILLEPLTETLQQKLARRKLFAKSTASSTRSLHQSSRLSFNFWSKPYDAILQRNNIEEFALPITRAMQFLHKHRVIFRDLKPDNVGVTAQGQIRIFDFGLARIVDPNTEYWSRLTACAGTPRYMAPECALRGDYSFPADVYSYAILLWEICTLDKPFKRASTYEELVTRVTRHHTRPSLKKIASKSLRTLLQASWNANPDARPTFASITNELERELGYSK